MDVTSAMFLGLGILGGLGVLVVLFAGYLRGRLDNPETANDVVHPDAFTVSDDDHSAVVHTDDVGFERR